MFPVMLSLALAAPAQDVTPYRNGNGDRNAYARRDARPPPEGLDPRLDFELRLRLLGRPVVHDGLEAAYELLQRPPLPGERVLYRP